MLYQPTEEQPKVIELNAGEKKKKSKLMVELVPAALHFDKSAFVIHEL